MKIMDDIRVGEIRNKLLKEEEVPSEDVEFLVKLLENIDKDPRSYFGIYDYS